MQFLGGRRALGPCIFGALPRGKKPEDRPIKISNWQATEEEQEKQSWHITELKHQAELEQHKGDLTRDFVRDVFTSVCDDRAIIWTLVWGYPKGRIQMSRPNMKRAVRSAGNAADAVNAMRTGNRLMPANSVLGSIHAVSSGIKTSTSSKIAYFAGLQAKEGQCLILDEKVIVSILYNRFDQLRPLIRKMLSRPQASYRCLGEQIDDAIKRQAQSYGDYVRYMNRLAEKQGICPSELEAFLFANGPDPKTMTAINDEWDAIRGKSRRRKRR